MKLKAKNTDQYSKKYDLFMVLLVISAILFIVAIWMWYDQKNKQLEQQIFLLK